MQKPLACYGKSTLNQVTIILNEKTSSYLGGSELHPPADVGVWGRRFKPHGLPVCGLNVLIKEGNKKLSFSFLFPVFFD